MAVACVLSSVGVLLCAISYAMGRASGDQGAQPIFWLGQVLLFTAIVARMLQRSCTTREAWWGALALSAGSYIVKICYSPVEFSFPDELQHTRSLLDLLATGGMHTLNPSLPISTSYPGQELITAAVVQLTHQSPFVSGLEVIGFAHLLLAAALFAFARTITSSGRAAGLACAVYAVNPHYQQFDAMFLYQAIGLPLAVSCLWMLARADGAPRRQRRLWLVLSSVLALAVIPVHHVSTYSLMGILFCLALVQLVRRRWRAALHAVAVLVLLTLATVVWVAKVAPDTLLYFDPAIRGVVKSVEALVHPHAASQAPPQAGSGFDHVFSYGYVLITAAGLAWAVLRWRRYSANRAWIDACILGSLAFFGALAVRLGTSDGAELYGRMLTFVQVPVAIVLAMVAIRPEFRAWERLRAPIAASVMTLAMLALWVGGLTSGWPPAWERLPHGYIPGGFDSSMNDESVNAALWAKANLPLGSNWATDYGNFTILGALGAQNTKRDVADLFNSPRYIGADDRLVDRLDLQFVLCDYRLTQQLPGSGSYFTDDPKSNLYTKPMDPQQLNKFEGVGGISRLYDSGTIVVFDVRSVHYDS